MRREQVLRTVRVALVVLGICPFAAQAFGWPELEQRAQALAAATFAKPDANLPAELRQLTYEQYQNIRFKPDHAYWHGAGLPIELAFFHRGMAFDQAVKINELVGSEVHEIKYTPDAFDFGPTRIEANKLRNLGYAGFRVHYAINSPRVNDEVLVFLGASYFRALGRGQVYGLSARGLAINTAENGGEEFPRFVEFWIDRPAPAAREFTIYALLDSPRVAGAYRFILKPGPETSIEVSARLYPRESIAKLGIAPLSSMYFFGENQPARDEDYRPEVHDSDGLSISAGNGDWIWRPLVNPKRLLVTSFATGNLGGFGLQQRDRNFSSYEELATRYDLRPSVWIEPQGSWGAGRVELVQLPTPDETNDNIMAYWVPDKPPQPRQPYELRYRILWQKDKERRPPLLWVMQTRRGPDHLHRQENTIVFAVDFVGAARGDGGLVTPAAAIAAAPPRPESGIGAVTDLGNNATLLQSRIERNEFSGGWRLTLVLRRIDQAKPVEMRAYLVRENKPASETWNYILPPE